jgi:putative nucleotidyltransferase with HDIG domain
MRAPTSSAVDDARDFANLVLAALPDRWRHTCGVASQAAYLASTLPSNTERDVLVAAAWLHDVGYGRAAIDTGFHPVDGARFIERHGWPHRIAALVAHHSGAAFVARDRGFDAVLAAYPHEQSATSDALTYADQTTGPRGQRMNIEQRAKDMLARHGPDSPNARVHHVRGPYLAAIAARVERRLRSRAVAQPPA